MLATWEIREGHVLRRLREMPEQSVQTVVTSPPYWGLRDYGIEPTVWGGDSEHDHEWGDTLSVRETTYGGKTRWQHVHNGRGEFQESRADREGWLRSEVGQGRLCECGAWLGSLGLEPSPELYVDHLVLLFREVRRVLRSDGTLWLNLGDSYANDAKWGGSSGGKHVKALHGSTGIGRQRQFSGLKGKDLVGVPWRAAFALQADGWWLRSDIIWAKPNPMPESVGDRPTKAHEYLFLLAKSARYFYDAEAIREPDSGQDHARSVLEGQPSLEPSNGLASPHRGLRTVDGRNGLGRNKRSVWEIPTHPYSEAHFATFPPRLVEPCILAGAPEKACERCAAPWERIVERERPATQPAGWRESERWGESHAPGDLSVVSRTAGLRPQCDCTGAISGPSVVLDPFAGSGTTGLVALQHGRSFVGIELNPRYAEMARERIRQDAPLLNVIAEVGA